MKKTSRTHQSSIAQKLMLYLAIFTFTITATIELGPYISYFLSFFTSLLILFFCIVILKIADFKQFNDLRKGFTCCIAWVINTVDAYKKSLAITLQLTVAIIFSFFAILITLMWVKQLLNPIADWKFYGTISVIAICGVYMTWWTLYIINSPVVIDRRILKLIESKVGV